MQVGIDSFAAAFDENSRAVNPAERLRQLVQQIEHADAVGLDAFGVGEDHRREFLDSAPVVILGAAAARTQRIRLTSAVTPDEVVDKIMRHAEALGAISRVSFQMNAASLPQVKMMRAIDEIGARAMQNPRFTACYRIQLRLMRSIAMSLVARL